MPEQKPISAPVQAAHTVLQQLRADHPDLARALETKPAPKNFGQKNDTATQRKKAAKPLALLPAFALKLEKSGVEVTAEVLLEHALKGPAYLRAFSFTSEKKNLSHAGIRARNAALRAEERGDRPLPKRTPIQLAGDAMQEGLPALKQVLADHPALLDKPEALLSQLHYEPLDIVSHVFDLCGYNLPEMAKNGHWIFIRVQDTAVVDYMVEKLPDVMKARIPALLDHAIERGNLEMVRHLKEKHKADLAHIEFARIKQADAREDFAMIDYILPHHAFRDDKRLPELFMPEMTRRRETWPVNAARWQAAVRQDPPQGLDEENPLFFRAAAYEAARQMLAAEGKEGPAANRMAFRAAALFGTEQRMLEYAERWSTFSVRQPFHDAIEGLWLPRSDAATNLKDWGDALLKCGPQMRDLTTYCDRLLSPLRDPNGAWSLNRTRAATALYVYKRGAENPGLSALFNNLHMREATFEEALAITAKPVRAKKLIPDIAIDGAAFGMPGAVFRRLAAGDPKALAFGKIVGCCQHLEGENAEAAKHSFTSKFGGLYVIEKNEEILGGAWAWRGFMRGLCLDSLETLGNRVTDAQWLKALEVFADRIAEKNDTGLRRLHVGAGGGTPESLSKTFRKAGQYRKLVPRDIGTEITYDSKAQYVIRRFAK